MKKQTLWPALALSGGCGAFLLRWVQLDRGFDVDTRLAITGSLWGRLLPLYLVALAVLFLLLSRKSAPAGVCRSASLGQSFPVGKQTALPLAAGALWLAGGALELMAGRSSLSYAGSSFAASLAWGSCASGVLAVLAGVCLFTVLCPSSKDGRRVEPNAVPLLLAAAALVVRLVLQYRSLSSNPSLQAYYLPLVGITVLCLSFYLAGGFAFRAGRSRRFLLTAAMGTVLCLGAAADSDLPSRLFFLGGGLWLLELLRLHSLALCRRDDAPPVTP